MRYTPRVLLGFVAIATAACGGGGADREGAETGSADSAAAAAPEPEPKGLEVASVMIGKAIGANNLITEPTFQFAPQDTVYVSVGMTGVPDSAVLTAVWHFQTGQVIDSTSQTIRAEGPQNTEFHVSRPKGWQPGTYKVTVYADGDSVDARTFAVRRQ